MINFENVTRLTERYINYCLYRLSKHICASPNPEEEHRRISQHFSFHYVSLNGDRYLTQLRKVYDEFKQKGKDFSEMLRRLEIERQNYHSYLGICDSASQLSNSNCFHFSDSKSKIKELIRWQLFSRIVKELMNAPGVDGQVMERNKGAAVTSHTSGATSASY
jgi:hypothetical protein